MICLKGSEKKGNRESNACYTKVRSHGDEMDQSQSDKRPDKSSIEVPAVSPPSGDLITEDSSRTASLTQGQGREVPDDGVLVESRAPGRDEPDRVSIFSLYMDKDFQYYFQHPYCRFGVAYLVTFCNFLIYAEDPVAHSEQECFIPVVGNCFSFVCTKYPPNAWAFLKVALWVTAIVVGLIVGKLVVHKIVFNRWFRLKMFLDDAGSWMTMFFTTILCLFIFSWLYNALLMIGGEATQAYRISSLMGIKNSHFMKAAATGTWCGDFFTAWMVTDIMLQEKLYPHWAKGARTWWKGYNRIILFWVITLGTSTAVVMVISTDWILWDRLNRDFLATNEVARGFLASFILVMDLLIVMQDWDFPHFINNFDIKLPGLNTPHIKIHLPRCLRRDQFVVHITGKWFNYGIIFMVLILDLNMWKNQIFYGPFEYGQYTGPLHKIHTVRDSYSLANHNETYLSYDWRLNTTNPLTNASYIAGDMVMNSRYYHYPLVYTALAFIPSLAAFVCLGVLVWYFGRWKPTPLDPHAGRLKKRPRRRSRWPFSRRQKPPKTPEANLTSLKVDQDDGRVRVFTEETIVGLDGVTPANSQAGDNREARGTGEANGQGVGSENGFDETDGKKPKTKDEEGRAGIANIHLQSTDLDDL